MIPSSLSAAPIALLGGSTGTGELLLLFVAVLILFGPRKLPEVARMLGRAMQELRRATNDFRDQIVSIDVDKPPPTKVVSTPKVDWAPQRLPRCDLPLAGAPDTLAVSPPAVEASIEPPKEA